MLFSSRDNSRERKEGKTKRKTHNLCEALHESRGVVEMIDEAPGGRHQEVDATHASVVLLDRLAPEHDGALELWLESEQHFTLLPNLTCQFASRARCVSLERGRERRRNAIRNCGEFASSVGQH